MTRVAVLSDIHGNMTALRAVIEDLNACAVDRVIVAGDVVNWGPHNVEVIQHVTSEGWIVMRGNQEWYLLDQDTERAPSHWNSYDVARWTRRQLGDQWLNVIATWPDTLSLRFRDAPTLRIVHGSPRSHFESIFPLITADELSPMMAGVAEMTLVCAHTHLQFDRQVDQWHVVNVGTVGMPLDGTSDATYMILDSDWTGWHATTRRVSFNIDSVRQDLEAMNFTKTCGPIGTLVMEEFRTSRLRVAPFLTWKRTLKADQLDQSEAVLVDRFLAEVEPWDYTPAPYRIGANEH